MPDRNQDREPRWTNTGYWTDREEDDDREGDRSRTRDYDREDMRRYAQGSIEQSERLRRLRGQTDPDWGSRPRSGYRPPHERGFREIRRSEREDRFSLRDEVRSREHPPSGRYDRRAGEYQGWSGRSLRQWNDGNWPGRNRYESDYPQDDTYWTQDQEGDHDDNLVGNYWGERQMREQYDRSRPVGGFHTARGPNDSYGERVGRGTRGGRRQAGEWSYSDDDQGFDMDPGFSYEFGTDFDFLDEDEPERHPNRPARMIPRERSGFSGQPARRQGRDVPGPFYGIGPRSYQRPDHRILEDVCEYFTHSGRLDPSGITVQVENGAVILEGEVQRKADKRLAEDIAERVSGVKDVHNRLRLARDNRSAGSL